MNDSRLPRMVMNWFPHRRRKRGRSQKTWGEGIQNAMSDRNLTTEQFRNHEEW